MNKTVILVIFTLLLGLTAGYLLQNNLQKNQVAKNTDTLVTPTSQATRNNCLADDCLIDGINYPVSQLPDDVKNALNKALMDEYKAYATYQTVMDKFGNIRPFIMIARSEQQHIAALQGIYEKYGLKIPENKIMGTIPAPDSIKEACAIGVQDEIDNVKLYRESLLPVVNKYEDITIVFTNLMNASAQKHLPAFQRCD